MGGALKGLALAETVRSCSKFNLTTKCSPLLGDARYFSAGGRGEEVNADWLA